MPSLQARGNGGEAQLSPQTTQGSLWPLWTLWLPLLRVVCLSSLCYRYMEVLLTFLLQSGDGLNVMYVQGRAICAFYIGFWAGFLFNTAPPQASCCWLQKENAMCHTRRLAA